MPFHNSLLRSVYDTLPTPTNLHRWGIGRIHGACYVGKEARWCTYWQGARWHLAWGDTDSVMGGSSEHWLTSWSRPCKTSFIHPGHQGGGEATLPTENQEYSSTLLDLVVQTSLGPDIVIWSEEAERIILIALTFLWEDRCEEALERKVTKYRTWSNDVGTTGGRSSYLQLSFAPGFSQRNLCERYL